MLEPYPDSEDDIRSPQIDELTEETEPLDTLDKVDREKETTTPPLLSLHAIQGSQGLHTMRVATTVGASSVISLVCSGSTHNFVDSRFAKKLNLYVEPTCKLKVTITDERCMLRQGICRAISWETPGYSFKTDFLVLLLKGCDLVLRV